MLGIDLGRLLRLQRMVQAVLVKEGLEAVQALEFSIVLIRDRHARSEADAARRIQLFRREAGEQLVELLGRAAGLAVHEGKADLLPELLLRQERDQPAVHFGRLVPAPGVGQRLHDVARVGDVSRVKLDRLARLDQRIRPMPLTAEDEAERGGNGRVIRLEPGDLFVLGQGAIVVPVRVVGVGAERADHDILAGGSRGEIGDQRDADPGGDEPKERVVIVVLEGDVRFESRGVTRALEHPSVGTGTCRAEHPRLLGKVAQAEVDPGATHAGRGHQLGDEHGTDPSGGAGNENTHTYLSCGMERL